MKIIDTTTKQIIDITNIDFYRNLINASQQENKYSPESPILIGCEIIATLKETVDEMLVNAILTTPEYVNFVKLSEYNDWKYPDRAFRIAANSEQRDTIADIHPELLVSLNEGIPNPKVKLGNIWLVYVNSFLEGAREYLESIGCIIESNPNTITSILE